MIIHHLFGGDTIDTRCPGGEWKSSWETPWQAPAGARIAECEDLEPVQDIGVPGRLPEILMDFGRGGRRLADARQGRQVQKTQNLAI